MLFLSFHALALVASIASKGPKPPSTPAPIGALFTADDYPSEAKAADEEGTVTTRIDVDAVGRVSGCTVTSSSGSPSLDAETCRLIKERAKFQPAKDERGRKTYGSVVQRITWRLQGDLAPNLAWAVRTTVTLAAQKQPTCVVEDEGAMKLVASTPGEGCARLLKEASSWTPTWLQPGQSVSFTLEERFLPGTVQPEDIPLPSGAAIASRQVLHLDFNAAGRIERCTIAEELGPAPPPMRDCKEFKRRLQPKLGEGGEGVPFTGTFVFTGIPGTGKTD
ncbi:energy transducer TonB [Sphingomonas piscis]|uniref:Energy transducer TonB n=1 Tax=Sphingomonas piscis TaxID=2714943 RepID=A0A6G7YRK6_9SPHN|nr:energy transducer TonB [Sphingomonas piscis]QIK79375.1 energy transducer TonB [Sphingomonas piscis]